MSYNRFNESTLFCDTYLWDSNKFWNSTDPHFTSCFRKTILVSSCHLSLILLIPFDIRYFKTNTRSIPWRWRNVSSLMLTLGLIGSSLVFALQSVWLDVHLWSTVFEPSVDFIGFTISFLCQIMFRKNARRVSVSLSIYWLLTFFISVIRLYSELYLKDDQQYINRHIIYYGIYISLSFNLFIISFITDEASRYEPLEAHQPDTFYCPLENKNAFSRLTLFWLATFIRRGFHHKFEFQHLNKLCYSMRSNYVTKLFNQLDSKYNKHQNLSGFLRREKSLLPIIWSINKWPIIFSLLLHSIYLISLYSQPYSIYLLLTYLMTDSQTEPLWHPVLYAFMYSFSGLLASLTLVHADTLIHMAAIRCKSALISAVYQKIFKLSPSSRSYYDKGKIINLMSTECHETSMMISLAIELIVASASLSIGIFFLWQYLESASLVVIIGILLIEPITGLIVKISSKTAKNQILLKDTRIKKLSEALNCIKILKFNAWENIFGNIIHKIRKKEIQSFKTMAFLNSILYLILSAEAMYLSGSCFIFYVLTNNGNFNARTIFVSLSIVYILRSSKTSFSTQINHFIHTFVALKKIKKFLSAEELDDCATNDKNNNMYAVSIENANFAWKLNEEVTLSEISLNVRKGTLVAIVGQVGSGKSSLLSAITNHVYKLCGSIHIKGSLAVVPQYPWIQNTSIKKNIIFTSPLDEYKYQEVIEACALVSDIKMLAKGDETQIGEGGIDVSESIKQKICLARAIYHDAEIYLLDDPVSSIEDNLAQQLFQRIIGSKGLLRNKTRILCTHEKSFLLEADEIFAMRDGEIVAHGTYDELFITDLFSTEIFSPDEVKIDNIKSKRSSFTPECNLLLKHLRTQSALNARSHSLLDSASIKSLGYNDGIGTDIFKSDEEYIKRGLKWRDYYRYIGECGFFFLCILFLLQIGFNASEVGANYWLSVWSNETTSNLHDRDFRLKIYFSLIGSEVLFIMLANIALYSCAIYVSRKLHNNALYRVLKSPLRFFENVSTDKILKRFNNDLVNIDKNMPLEFLFFTKNITWFPIIFLIVWKINYFLALELIVSVFLFYGLYKIYFQTSNEFKRLESLSISPFENHFGESIDGTQIIRSFNVVLKFISKFNQDLDLYINCYHHRVSLQLWLQLWCTLFASIITLSTALCIVYKREEISVGLAGLILTYALEAANTLYFTIRVSANLETHMVSMYRLKRYTKLPSEAKWNSTQGLKPPKNWPTGGTIEFENFSATNSAKHDPALIGINLIVQKGEKVGIFGTAGSGKSLFGLSLFRIIEPTGGRIILDHIDISKIGLHDLRTKISFIPQDPLLFSASLRFNLDPMGEFSDVKLRAAIREAHLNDFVSSSPEGLDLIIADGGVLLSSGHRRLICLARALLKRNKILVFSEDENNVYCRESDRLIQMTIRNKLSAYTVLTITNRLESIIHYDRTVILDGGTIIENDSPINLVSNTNSKFYSLAKEAGIIFS